MRSVKLYMSMLILLVLIFSLPHSVSAFSKYKVAVLPIINTENVKTTEISDLIQYKIQRKLRFPFYEFIPDTEIAAALKTLIIRNGTILPDKNNLSFLSQALSADIVLVVEIKRARVDLQNHFSLWDRSDETIETTDVLLKCYAYSAMDNQYYSMKAEKYNSEPVSTNSGLLPAITSVIDELLKKIPFTTIPSSISTELKTSKPIIP